MVFLRLFVEDVVAEGITPQVVRHTETLRATKILIKIAQQLAVSIVEKKDTTLISAQSRIEKEREILREASTPPIRIEEETTKIMAIGVPSHREIMKVDPKTQVIATLERKAQGKTVPEHLREPSHPERTRGFPQMAQGMVRKR